MYNTIYKTTGYCDLDTVADTPPPPTTMGWWSINKNQEVENTMFDECTPRAPNKMRFKVSSPVANAQVINAVPVESTQRDYAIGRIEAIGEKHAKALRPQFFMDAQDQPQTAVALIKAITEGDFILDQNAIDSHAEEIERGYYNSFFGIKWGKNKPDVAGYKAAKDTLKVFIQKAVDQATLREVTELEAIIDGVEAWTLPTN